MSKLSYRYLNFENHRLWPIIYLFAYHLSHIAFPFLCLLFFFGACSSELDIIYEHQTVPVVYAVINPYDTVHYVRVQKTFIINTKEDWAHLNSDSLQFRDVEVFMYGKQGDSIKWMEEFTETSVTRDDGFFPTEGFQAFKLDHPFPIHLSSPSRATYGHADIDSLILEVRIHDLDLVTKASAKVLNASKIIAYKSADLLFLYGGKPSVFALSGTGEDAGTPFSVVFRQIEFRVHYKEYYWNSFANKEISWMTHDGWDGSAYFLNPERLLDPMKLRLTHCDSLIERKLDSIDIAMLTPSRFFNDYWFIRDHWEATDRPPYSNFDNSYGMFITIARDKLTGLKLNWQSIDSLCNGQFYKEMKFVNW